LFLGQLKQHFLIHEKDPYKFECDICNAKFQTAYSVKVHKASHGPPKFFCTICSRGFKTNNVLKMHIKNIHESTGERNVKCPKCPAAYKNKNGLKSHLLTHNDYNLPCFWCTSIFKKPSIRLEHHKKYHSIEFAEYKKANPTKLGRASKYEIHMSNNKN
jgi:KRAB domain-containing zinc finger protein